MDFDRVLNNIRELNILAGEGCSDITRTKDGARLKVFQSPITPSYAKCEPLLYGAFYCQNSNMYSAIQTFYMNLAIQTSSLEIQLFKHSLR